MRGRCNRWRQSLLVLLVCITFGACHHGPDKKTDQVPTAASGSGQKIVLNRPDYTLTYPAGWRIDSSSKLYNIDSHFTLHSPVESGLITFFMFNVQKDEKETLEKHIRAQLANTMKDGTVSYFTTWGNYEGHGATLKGRLEGLYKSELKIFVYGTKDYSFLIVSICADGYRDEVLPGLTQIASSFKIKHATVVVPANHS
ncbi:hypothetical protein [Ferruginibacter sp. SUN106]|uniref:hypothetical protein n=1 Tax=Ferruginibacter sp. SUN106 TaxID=2978348 RepID=UPI003D36B5C6